MFRNEREFVDFVEKALSDAGYALQREVPIGARHRLDLLAVRDGVRKGIEVKFTSRGILDDLAKSRTLLRLPEVDEMYVCGPKVFMSEDALALARSLGVGLLAVSDTGELTWPVQSKPLEPARLSLGGNYTGVVLPGGDAVYNATVFNTGQKTAVNRGLYVTGRRLLGATKVQVAGAADGHRGRGQVGRDPCLQGQERHSARQTPADAYREGRQRTARGFDRPLRSASCEGLRGRSVPSNSLASLSMTPERIGKTDYYEYYGKVVGPLLTRIRDAATQLSESYGQPPTVVRANAQSAEGRRVRFRWQARHVNAAGARQTFRHCAF